MIPQKIAVIGASTCYGSVDRQKGGFVGRLREWHEAEVVTNVVFNLGVPGDTTIGILNRLNAEMKPRSPGLIIVQHGINDIRREGSIDAHNSESLEDFKNNVRRIIIRAQSYADVLFVGTHPINQSVTTPVSWATHFFLLDDVRSYATSAAEICSEMSVGYIDVFSAWSSEDYSGLLDENGLHPNAAGHENIFEKVKAEIVSMYPDSPDSSSDLI